MVSAGFIAECIKKRSPISVKLKAVIKPSRHQLNCHGMLLGTLERNHTSAISVIRLSFVMMISSVIIASTLVSSMATVWPFFFCGVIYKIIIMLMYKILMI